MNLVLGFDTETTGLIKYREKSDHPDQPHIVQLAAGLYNTDTKNLISSIDLIVKPEGWIIPDASTDVHGITTEYALEVGIPEKDVIKIFHNMAADRKRIAYNVPFDKRIIRIATKRHCLYGDAEEWNEGEFDCAMKKAREVIGGKNCKLTEAYSFFMGKEMKNAHNAMADTQACMDVYFAALEY